MGSLHQTPFLKPQRAVEEPKVVDDSKESVFQTQQSWCTYELTGTGTACTGLHKLKLDKIPAQKRGCGHKVPPLTEMLFEINTHSERENQFSPMEGHWVYQLHCRVLLMLRDSWSTQNRLLLYFALYWFGLVLCVCVLWFGDSFWFGFESFYLERES